MGTWTGPQLDALRKEADPSADAVVEAIFRRHEVERVSALLRQLIRNDTPTPAELPAEVRAWLAETAALPAWADPARIARAELVMSAHGPLVLSSLLCASLPECYVARRGVPVLWLTQRLEQHAKRRLFETAQLVIDVLHPAGLAPQGSGVRAAQRVRLMHAAIRHLILADGPVDASTPQGLPRVLLEASWKDELGLPINQEDMAYTLLTFSHVIPRSLVQLGVRLDAQDRAAFLHAWNVVGHVLGVRRDLLPPSPAEAEALFEAISARETGASPEGREMTRTLIATCEEVLPGHLPKHVPHVLVRELIGAARADLLGVPAARGFTDALVEDLVRGLRWVERFGHAVAKDFPPARAAAEHLGLGLATALTRMPRGWERGLFDIPESLAVGWGVATP